MCIQDTHMFILCESWKHTYGFQDKVQKYWKSVAFYI